jgi:hypothetical protein
VQEMLLTVALWIAGVFLAAVQGLLSLSFRLYKEANEKARAEDKALYEERLKRIDGELKTLRERMHDWAPHIGWVEQERQKQLAEWMKEQRK